MTSKERLKEIEYENTMSGGDRDLTWLITRVKRLTQSLEGYANLPDGTYHGPDDIYEDLGEAARKALSEDQ